MDTLSLDYSESDSGFINGLTVYTIPEVSIDYFYTDATEIETCPNSWKTKIFFLTKCTDDTFASLVEGDFLLELFRSPFWKLYMTDIMFGYLKYAEAISCSPWNQDIPCGFLDKLRGIGKIIILHQTCTMDIPSLRTECRSVNVTYLQWGLMSQLFEFEVRQAGGTSSKSVHIGTAVMEDILIRGKYPINPDLTCPVGKGGFPAELKNTSATFRITRTFAVGLQEIRKKLETDKTLHFELGICSSDKLVDLWYMKHMRDEFGWKVHVSKEYFTFVENCIPEFIDTFAVDNHDGKCRFHYDCSELCTNEDCVPGKEWAIDFNVEDLFIGWKEQANLRVREDCIRLPFIHEI